LDLAWQPDPTTLGPAAMSDPTTLGPAAMSDPTTFGRESNATNRNCLPKT